MCVVFSMSVHCDYQFDALCLLPVSDGGIVRTRQSLLDFLLVQQDLAVRSILQVSVGRLSVCPYSGIYPAVIWIEDKRCVDNNSKGVFFIEDN